MPRLKPGTMVTLETPLCGRAWVFSEYGQPQQLAILPLSHPEGQVRAVIWKAYGDYVWASLWLEENAYEMGSHLDALLDTRELVVLGPGKDRR